jgi:rhodanese-related sulfurtransferase
MMDCGTQCSVNSKIGSISKKRHGKIDTHALANLIASGVPLVILDARGGKYDDGKRIASAQKLSYEATEKQAAQVIPSLNSLIVVYCSNLQCPASDYLASRLSELGYVNILKYPEGIQEWINAGHPVHE